MIEQQYNYNGPIQSKAEFFGIKNLEKLIPPSVHSRNKTKRKALTFGGSKDED